MLYIVPNIRRVLVPSVPIFEGHEQSNLCCMPRSGGAMPAYGLADSPLTPLWWTESNKLLINFLIVVACLLCFFFVYLNSKKISMSACTDVQADSLWTDWRPHYNADLVVGTHESYRLAPSITWALWLASLPGFQQFIFVNIIAMCTTASTYDAHSNGIEIDSSLCFDLPPHLAPMCYISCCTH